MRLMTIGFTKKSAQHFFEALTSAGVKRVADVRLLCSEHEPRHCHRRLVAEYLGQHWGGIEIRHLS